MTLRRAFGKFLGKAKVGNQLTLKMKLVIRVAIDHLQQNMYIRQR